MVTLQKAGYDVTQVSNLEYRMKSAIATIVLFATSPLWATSAYGADLTGTYDVGTLTPLERPEAFGNELFLSAEQAREMEQRFAAQVSAMGANSDPDRDAPAAGGNIGGYNFFWIDPGSTHNSVDGRFRTSIITYPENGRIPAMTEQGAARLKGMLDQWQIVWRNPDPTVGRNTGKAWWLELPGAAPYDHLEQRPLAERCIIGSRSTAGPPMLPNIYNNHKRIIQTPDHVMILTEMNHDARVIRLNSTHRPTGVGTWLGDSVGHWEGDTLVVQTRNFKETPALSGADENLEVTERFTRMPDNSLRYEFEISNPTVWTDVWRGQYSWKPSDDKVYEYACHEGNYALGNIMRGARRLEADVQAQR